MKKEYNPCFITRKCSEMSEDEIKACSELYSNHYGVYSGKDGKRDKGTRIRLGIQYYQNIKQQNDMYVSLCYDGNILLGQSFFLKKTIKNGEVCTWVTQLVVHHSYRGRGIATRLLQSAWGFSNYFAWGLATANAVTIKTLEAVTWRKVDPIAIKEHLNEIGQLCDEIPFTDKKNIDVTVSKSQIFTNFYPEFEKLDTKKGLDTYITKLGAIQDGYEWLAFTFRTQKMWFDEKHFNQMLDFSASQLEDAYGRMKMGTQTWTRHTSQEIDFILKHTQLKKGMKVLDMGCGQGRHVIELAKRGYNVTGVDFSERLLKEAQNASKELSVTLKKRDCRDLKIRGTFDVIICLYDVIGSYRTKKDNYAIIESIHKKLRKNGLAVISVMNMELTKQLAKQLGNVKKDPSLLLDLKASDIMQKTGNIFNPDYFLLDDENHLVYRKEQFEQDGLLSSEYIIADYRFTKDEICQAFEDHNFNIISATYVQAGKWSTPLNATDPKAKEILLVVEKR